MEVTVVLFYTYMTSDQLLETCTHIVLTDGKIRWDPENLTMNRNMPYRDEACFE